MCTVHIREGILLFSAELKPKILFQHIYRTNISFILPLFRNKRFMVDEMFQRNDSKYLPYFWNMKTQIVIFSFFISCYYFIFPLMIALVCRHVFVFQKYGKFLRISLGHFIKHKALISMEYYSKSLIRKMMPTL